MPSYLFFFIDGDGRLVDARDRYFSSDREAQFYAETLPSRLNVDIWQSNRHVGCVDRSSASSRSRPTPLGKGV